MKKIVRFFVGVKEEMKKVRWPDKKMMVTYSIATLTTVLVFALFFVSLDIIFTELKMVIK